MLGKLGTCRPGRGLQDYKTAIIDLLNEARSSGQTLRSLELGEALRLFFGEESYNEFRKNKLRTAVEHLGFRTRTPDFGWRAARLPRQGQSLPAGQRRDRGTVRHR